MGSADFKFWIAAGLAAYFFYKWNEACFVRSPLASQMASGSGNDALSAMGLPRYSYSDGTPQRSYVPEQKSGCKCHG